VKLKANVGLTWKDKVKVMPYSI